MLFKDQIPRINVKLWHFESVDKYFYQVDFINEMYQAIHLYWCIRIPVSLCPHSIFKLFAFVSYIGYFKDSSQH